MSEKMTGLESVMGVVLAGGLGSRLRPVVMDRPKVLAEVGGRPFLAYILDQLDHAGMREVVLCTGFLAEAIWKTFGDRYKSLTLRYSQETHPLGTGGALRQAMPHCLSDPILVLNGDSFVDSDLEAYLEWFYENGLAAAMLLTMVPNASRFGRVVVRQDGLIMSFEEKSGSPDAGLINAGVYILKKSMILSIPEGKSFSLERQLFPHLMGKSLYGYVTMGNFIDIGTPESYLAAQEFFKDNKIIGWTNGELRSRLK
jgi:D-glycero-alpha-D-manno-heptose 1-phosphate guanylyltransferase